MATERKTTKEEEAAGWGRRRAAGVPLDEEHFASDGIELLSTVGRRRKT